MGEIDTGTVDYVHDKIILYRDEERHLLTDEGYTDFNLANIDFSMSIGLFESLIQERGFRLEGEEITTQLNDEQAVQNMAKLIQDIYRSAFKMMNWKWVDES